MQDLVLVVISISTELPQCLENLKVLPVSSPEKVKAFYSLSSNVVLTLEPKGQVGNRPDEEIRAMSYIRGSSCPLNQIGNVHYFIIQHVRLFHDNFRGKCPLIHSQMVS